MGADSRRRVVVVAYPQVDVLDVAGPCEVFASVQDALGRSGMRHQAGYTVEVFSSSRALTIDTDSGVRLQAHRSILDYRGAIDTLLVAGGIGSAGAANDPALLRWLGRMASRVRRLGSVCTGAFVLAAAGLLNGRRATTHWSYCTQLARAYPQIEVDPDCIFIRDGAIFTSAGVTAGMDLALALVEEDYGRAIALAIARHLVLFVRRPGGQCQFSAQLQIQAADREPLRELQAWIAEHLNEDLCVERLAARVHMSVRNFARVFRKDVGWTPAQFVEQLRVEAARRRLEESDAGLAQVARECGFGSADSMCRSFLRHLRVTPSDYRGRFQTGPRTLSGYPNSHLSQEVAS
jgi:transcriptional regulator GlxA family with amidase domain